MFVNPCRFVCWTRLTLLLTVHESLSSSSISGSRPRRFRALFASFPTHIRQIEAEQNAFIEWQRVQRRKAWLRWVGKLWPIVVGVALGLAAPQLYKVVVKFEPWGLWLVFPFAVLACRPELHAIAQLVRNLPMVVLYLQFPLEGLIARLALRRRVTAGGVAGQVFYLHYLAGLQLVMIGGAVTQALMR
jgi:hypothetical protein